MMVYETLLTDTWPGSGAHPEAKLDVWTSLESPEQLNIKSK